MYSFDDQEIIDVMEHSDTQIIAKSNALSAEEESEINQEFSHYEYIGSVALEALRIVQTHRGWISDQSLQAISAFLNVPVTELESIATFYQLIFRQPVGKEVLYLCNSASCWIMGCETLQRHIQNKLKINPGDISADGVFTLLQTPCLGDCDKAPVMMIGKEMYHNLNVESVSKILAKKKGLYTSKQHD